jgi:putative SOS response-associated peptidase YedK
MCGRYTNTKGPAEIDEHFGVPIKTSEGTRRYNIAPSEGVLAIVALPTDNTLAWRTGSIQPQEGLSLPWSHVIDH